MSERKYEKISLDRVKVLNSRNRDRTTFLENVRSIRDVGLLKPIVVNERGSGEDRCYELVCGEGRLLAYRQLGYPEIPAEVIQCTRKQALLMSLVENIARVPPKTMWFAREVKRMHDAGFSYADVGKIVGKCETYVRDYINLVEQGEERLINGVEQGLFPITFALLLGRSDSADLQHLLMDAFDRGLISSANVPTVRKIIELRLSRGKEPDRRDRPANYTLKQLKADIARITKEKEAFVQESSRKENRLLAVLDGLHALWQDERFVTLAEKQGLGKWPELQGNYGVTRPGEESAGARK
jgi:ParB family chromosome partitioning protein